MFSLLTFLFAILALSFLIFIHELGHYYMARREGMRVEVFSIGFGRPLFSWIRDGVKWQLGWLPFGGYVKIAGTETDKNQDPYAVKDGFFGKGPWARIKVAVMGPLVNIIFALMVFALLWVGGGREKNYSEFTKKIGWVDPKSELWSLGLRPGDEVSGYNNQSFQGAKDHIYAPMTGGDETEVQGYTINYWDKEKKPYTMKVKPYAHPSFIDKGIMTAGILNPASYVIYNRLPNGQDNPLPEGSPMADSGLEYGDRIVWVDGHLIFSVPQLTELLNDDHVLLTVQRGSETFLARVPRVIVREFKLDAQFKEELIDWQYEGELKGEKIQNLYALPYNLTNDGVVENRLKFIDQEKEEQYFPAHPYSKLEKPLEENDRIIAVDGQPVKYSYQILQRVQEKNVNVVVERNPKLFELYKASAADTVFDRDFDPQPLKSIISSIGSGKPLASAGKYYLLKPIHPKTRGDLALSPEKQAWLKNEYSEQKKDAESIQDPEKRAQVLTLLENRQKQYILGLPMIQDQKVEYNPIPTDMFASVFSEIYRTLGALFSGTLNPKWLSGPVGIVQVVHNQGMMGLNEMLYWIGAISLNLGILNLLPIPMLDGGTIVLSFFELITGKKMKPKTLEKVILPFAVLLIMFFVYVTFNDISRIFRG
jgi:regulator of sigma E protease